MTNEQIEAARVQAFRDEKERFKLMKQTILETYEDLRKMHCKRMQDINRMYEQHFVYDADKRAKTDGHKLRGHLFKAVEEVLTKQPREYTTEGVSVTFEVWNDETVFTVKVPRKQKQ